MLNLTEYQIFLWEANFNFDPKGDYPDKSFGLQKGNYGSGKVVTGGQGGDWGGSMQRALAFAKVANDFAGRNIISSQKRTHDMTASGKISDHSDENDVSYAVDLACRGEEGDRILAELMQWIGYPEYKGGHWFNFTKDGYRYQVGWRVPGHFDHIHVGVKKVGGSDTPAKLQTPLSKTGGDKPVTIKTLNQKGGEEKETDFQSNLKKFKEFLDLKAGKK